MYTINLTLDNGLNHIYGLNRPTPLLDMAHERRQRYYHHNHHYDDDNNNNYYY